MSGVEKMHEEGCGLCQTACFMIKLNMQPMSYEFSQLPCHPCAREKRGKTPVH